MDQHPINLCSENIVVFTPYQGKSKFEFWHNIEKGDILTVSIDLAPLGRNRGLYAPQPRIVNITKDESKVCTWNEMVKYLSKMRLYGQKSGKRFITMLGDDF
jgi:hypothetical protein